MATIFTPYIKNETVEKLLVAAFHAGNFNIRQFTDGKLQAACQTAAQMVKESSSDCTTEDLIPALVTCLKYILQDRH